MSLDVYLKILACDHCGRDASCVYTANITHNLNTMAKHAGIYKELWRPEEIGLTRACGLLVPLQLGWDWLRENKTEAEKYNPPNGWGNYRGLVQFVEQYLEACKKYPQALVSVSR